jgi:hypothetical protein
MGLESAEWIHLAQDADWWLALLNAAMKLPIPQKEKNLSS